jgi:ATP-binding cassette, subfamily B, bacterial
MSPETVTKLFAIGAPSETPFYIGATQQSVARPPRVLKYADTFVVLQAGRVIQDGLPDLLVRREGLYRQLVQREMDRLAKQAA